MSKYRFFRYKTVVTSETVGTSDNLMYQNEESHSEQVDELT